MEQILALQTRVRHAPRNGSKSTDQTSSGKALDRRVSSAPKCSRNLRVIQGVSIWEGGSRDRSREQGHTDVCRSCQSELPAIIIYPCVIDSDRSGEGSLSLRAGYVRWFVTYPGPAAIVGHDVCVQHSDRTPKKRFRLVKKSNTAVTKDGWKEGTTQVDVSPDCDYILISQSQRTHC